MSARVALALSASLFAFAVTALANPSDWTGSKKCGECHEAELADWQNGPHAKAADSLGKDSANPACLSCHATGEAPAGQVVETSVGCESCHGPGTGYSPDDVMRNQRLRTALGLVELEDAKARAAVCVRCHRSDLRLERFDPEKAWKSLPHGKGTP